MTPRPRSPEHRPLVLVVDDEEDLAASLAEFVRQTIADVRVEYTISGAAAMSVLTREQVDVIVTDFRMPGIDGLEVLRLVDLMAPDAGRIVITGFSNEIAAEALRKHRVDFVFGKPFHVQEFVAAIRGLVARRRGKASVA